MINILIVSKGGRTGGTAVSQSIGDVATGSYSS